MSWFSRKNKKAEPAQVQQEPMSVSEALAILWEDAERNILRHCELVDLENWPDGQSIRVTETATLPGPPYLSVVVERTHHPEDGWGAVSRVRSFVDGV